MLNLLVTLEYKCLATMNMGGIKMKLGGDCPDNVACTKVSGDKVGEFLAEIEENLPEGFSMSGTFAKCAVGTSPVQCNFQCKVPCIELE